jgi:8-oxo-dGTP diphosphatase
MGTFLEGRYTCPAEARMGSVRVVAGVLVRDGKVLAARRALHKREGGLWELPGGKVEPGEADAAALVRELGEELGVRVEVGAVVGESEHTYAHGTVRLVALRCSLVEGEPAALEHAEVRWLGAEELGTVEWAPADVPLLEGVRGVVGG